MLKHIKKLLEAGMKEGADNFAIYDTESTVYKGSDIKAAIKEMIGGDEELTIMFKKGKDVIGCFDIVLNGEDDPADDFVDYTDNDFCNRVCEKMGL